MQPESHGDNLHGHGGVSKTVLAIRQRYHFRNVRKAVQKYVGLCEDCIRAKSQQTATSSPLTPMVSSHPFSAIAIDLFSPGTTNTLGHRYVLTVVDMYTRWVSFIPLKTKYPAEVMWALTTGWFHVYGIPQVVLSDRGKEFLGVASSVCAALGIRHIKTTPYHPRTNGLCESQHKALTYELRIRIARPSAPQWDSLLTEISFSHNVTPAKVADGLSPFNLVFGRKPRLSPEDICFPVKRKDVQSGMTPRHISDKKYADALQTRLQGLRFRALDKTWEIKENLRERYDRAREGSIKTKGEKCISVGDIVSIYSPTKVLKKQTFQWSPPHFLVIAVSTNTCEVRSLIQTGGKHMAQLRKTGTVPSKVVNQKMTRSYPVPKSFFIGAKVSKQFGTRWIEGTIDRMDQDEGEMLWHVVYSDFDEEQLDKTQMCDVLVYHPLLDSHGDLEVPEVGSYVWYSHNQQPFLGQVISVDTTVPRPIVVQRFRPQANAVSLSRASFQRAVDTETGVS